MKIALLNTITPFVRGGAEIAVEGLNHHLRLHGHDPTIFRIPFPEDAREPLISTYLAARMLRFDNYDRVITFKFPAYCVEHPGKVMWMFHQFRQVYDLWEKPEGLSMHPDGKAIRVLVERADNINIPKSRHVYVIAQEVANRLQKYNNVQSSVLPTPLDDPSVYYCSNQGDYLYFPSRINSLKRQHLAVEAMKYTKSNVKLVITGICPDKNYLSDMRDTISKNNLEKKVLIRNEWIDDKEKIKLMAESLGVVYIPLLEDAGGLVTMESFYSQKPVIACTDSGGILELVENNVTGLVAEPTPKKIAEAMDKLYENKAIAEKMGVTAFEEITRRKITWENTIAKLLL